MTRVTLALGSNMSCGGKAPVQLLAAACDELRNHMQRVVFSSVYKTSPMYVVQQPDFYNMVVRGDVHDSVTPYALLKKINNIEKKYGRNRKNEIRFGPRPLDIDILLFGDETVCDSDLVIPHPRMNERAFVLVPLVEILSDCADDVIREKYAASLKLLFTQDVQLHMDAKEFYGMLLGGSHYPFLDEAHYDR
ncbi:MAG: 2-amino-4-hydroxy-6-hydroxymethyldihydropteridine diphosphokinase [Treponema sp.]|nr:2-amino-4-hydroxy-6-hydroxymethyldihydropteridine diphosphokinase [Treponema sp.]